jgi:hypothetical protein
MDAYTLMSSVGMVTHSGSEFCIPEEATEGERETEKTVRFNEVVSQRTYRFVILLSELMSCCRKLFKFTDSVFCPL